MLSDSERNRKDRERERDMSIAAVPTCVQIEILTRAMQFNMKNDNDGRKN